MSTEDTLSSASLCVELCDLKKVSEVLRSFHELTEVISRRQLTHSMVTIFVVLYRTIYKMIGLHRQCGSAN